MKRAAWLVVAGTVAGFLGVIGLHKTCRAGRAGQFRDPARQPGRPRGRAPPGPHLGHAHQGQAQATGTTLGALERYGYGELAARVSISGGQITGIAVPVLRTAEQYSQQLAVQVIPTLRSEVLAARSARINAVSGATYTARPTLCPSRPRWTRRTSGEARQAHHPASWLAAQHRPPYRAARPGQAPADPRGARDGHGRVVRGPARSRPPGSRGRDPGGLCAAAPGGRRVHAWNPDTPLRRLRRGDMPEADGPRSLAEVRAACQAAREASDSGSTPWAMPSGYDPTGLVKGWAVDRALGALRRAGLPAALVNGGGDLAAFGGPAPGEPWRAGIRHPWRPDALATVLEVRPAVGTSGSYERGAHLVDPHTGRPACRGASATVTGPSLVLADALATALAVGGDAVLAAVAGLPGYAGYLIRLDGTETWTSGIEFAAP